MILRRRAAVDVSAGQAWAEVANVLPAPERVAFRIGPLVYSEPAESDFGARARAPNPERTARNALETAMPAADQSRLGTVTRDEHAALRRWLHDRLDAVASTSGDELSSELRTATKLADTFADEASAPPVE